VSRGVAPSSPSPGPRRSAVEPLSGVSSKAGTPNAYRWEARCLADDPFAGDYGGSGGDDCVLSDRMVTNRGGGTCHMCAGPCAPGTRNRVRVEVYDGELMRFRWCVQCCFAMAAYALGRFSLADKREALGHERRMSRGFV
jgi:hypothetical protein